MFARVEPINNPFFYCREEGIRTLDTLVAYTHFPGVRLRPLGHLSIFCSTRLKQPFVVEMAIKNNTFSGREKAYLRNKCQISKKKQRDKII